mmetsp:Transcript_4060/g.5891  ORF Transcript_4060/g.5891 Transcript_4060/m.5891 type:complete len:374 (+) Transcript_4060:41-1162(+)
MSQSTTNEFKIPIVDFSSFLSLGANLWNAEAVKDAAISAAQHCTAKEIDGANKRHGFVCLRNTGIPKSLLQSTFNSTQELFVGLDEEVKNKTLKQIDPVTNVGYSGFCKESLNRKRKPDLKEAFNVRNTSNGSGTCSFQGTPEEFQRRSVELWNELKVLGYRFSVCCAVALGFEKDFFSKTFSTMDLCTLRMLHYPPCADGDDEDYGTNASSSSPVRVGEHTDFGLFTFLFVRDFQDKSSHGLQVKAVEGGDLSSTGEDFYFEGWNDVVFDEETLGRIDEDESCAVIVNTGALMARWTNDYWLATAHRVIVPSEEARLSHRYSIAMFFDPDKETICSVHPKLIEETGGKAKYAPIKSIDYLMLKLNEAQGVKS